MRLDSSFDSSPNSAARRVLTLLFSGLAGALVAVACSGNSAPSAAPGASGAAGMGEGGAADTDPEPVPDSLAFVPSKTVSLSPKQTQELTVESSPPGSYGMRFALIGSGSDSAPGDAVLDMSDVQTGADGIAHVTLTAPSAPTAFSVRASVAGRVQTLLGVSVSSLGYTRLRVLPQYSGQRPVTEWTATARTGSKCSKLGSNPPPDGPLATSAAANDPLYIEHIPIGVGVTVTLRAGHYVGGCADQSALSEGDSNQLAVYASDRPLNLDATRLDLSFGPSDARPTFAKLMKSGVSGVEAALTSSSGNDVQALLDAMSQATPTVDGDAFSAARLAQGWDAALGASFGSNAATRLREPADRWLSAGLERFAAADTFAGQLAARDTGALFKLLSVAGVAPSKAGFASGFQSVWSADSSDTLLLGTQLSWVPSRLLTALASAPALLEQPQAGSVEAALAQSVDCTLVGTTLLSHGTSPGNALYPGCDQTCALSACTSAISALWQRASGSSGATVATLAVTATGSAGIGDDAAAISLKGTWVGELGIGTDSSAASGALSAAASSN
jgi:hypothetical protein